MMLNIASSEARFSKQPRLMLSLLIQTVTSRLPYPITTLDSSHSARHSDMAVGWLVLYILHSELSKTSTGV
jgi:hypothetical protein